MTAENQLDLIDRNALKAEIEHIDWDKLARDGNLDDGINEVLHALNEVSTVDAVEVVHARWEEWCGLPKCPACGYEYTDYLECKNYCGNCGAKMDGGTNNG